MADEVRVSAPGPDGNGFSLDLREKKLGLTGPNVALLLLILIIGGIAYVRTGTVDKTMQAGQAQLIAIEDRFHKRISDLFLRIDKLVDDNQQQTVLLTANNAKVTAGQHELQTHLDTALTKQNELVAFQTTTIDAKVNTLEKYIEEWFSEVGRRLEIINFNALNPDKALPLRAPPPRDDPHHERGPSR
jgi:hypothetical protein